MAYKEVGGRLVAVVRNSSKKRARMAKKAQHLARHPLGATGLQPVDDLPGDGLSPRGVFYPAVPGPRERLRAWRRAQGGPGLVLLGSGWAPRAAKATAR